MAKALLLFFLAAQLLHAQKLVKKSIINHKIRAINIDAANCYRLDLRTVKGNEIYIEAIIDGEYRKELLLNLIQEGDTYQISSGFRPAFVRPDDKLGAHKVISISLKVHAPEHLKVSVYGKSCDVSATGTYKELYVVLNDGDCILTNVGEKSIVATQSGQISVHATTGNIKASTKYGQYKGGQIPDSGNSYVLNSVAGNILIKKIE